MARASRPARGRRKIWSKSKFKACIQNGCQGAIKPVFNPVNEVCRVDDHYTQYVVSIKQHLKASPSPPGHCSNLTRLDRDMLLKCTLGSS